MALRLFLWPQGCGALLGRTALLGLLDGQIWVQVLAKLFNLRADSEAPWEGQHGGGAPTNPRAQKPGRWGLASNVVPPSRTKQGALPSRGPTLRRSLEAAPTPALGPHPIHPPMLPLAPPGMPSWVESPTLSPGTRCVGGPQTGSCKC